MGNDPMQTVHLHDDPQKGDKSGGSGIVLFIISLALILALGFFYMTSERQQNKQADAMVKVADTVDGAAKKASEAMDDMDLRL